MLTVLTGALAGVIHVLAGPDHLAAVAPLALADRQRGWLAGWTWGVGHASGVVSVAALAVLLRDALPTADVISAWGERLVGVALIAVGLWALMRSFRAPSAPHAHASFLMGVLHGIAGTSHFFGVLPALALPTAAASITYILAFGAGTVTAMTAFAFAAGFAGARLSIHGAAYRALSLSTALLAIVIGGVWLTTPLQH